MADEQPKPTVSIVIPCYNEEESFSQLRTALKDLTRKLASRYETEIVLVDDGSRDETWARIQHFAAADNHVRGIALSRNFGHQVALTCGYDMAAGDAVVSMDADLQDPPEVVLEMVKKWEEGADIVYGVRSQRAGETSLKLLTAALFYRLFHALGRSQAPLDCGDFRLMSRRALEALRRMREQHRYVRGMVGWLGFQTAVVEYERQARVAGQTKYSYCRMLAFALDGLVSFSSFPLRCSYIFAFAFSLLVLLYLLYSLIAHVLFHAELVKGWTSLLLTTTIFGFLNLLSLGLIGEYIGRIYDEIKGRPLYLIKDLAVPPAPAKPPQPPAGPPQAPAAPPRTGRPAGQ
ncbi:MAG: glycosyltransferase family 2 protein [Planctomycetota bacterium]